MKDIVNTLFYNTINIFPLFGWCFTGNIDSYLIWEKGNHTYPLYLENFVNHVTEGHTILKTKVRVCLNHPSCPKSCSWRNKKGEVCMVFMNAFFGIINKKLV